MMCGIVDLGSNTIRLSIYQYEGEHFRLLLNKKTMAGLAGYVQDGALSDGGILVACRVLSSYRALLSNFSVSEMHVFATASLRNISNTGEAVEAIRDVTGVTVEVLDGETEAALSFKGAVLPGGVPTGLLADIGGGSTELTRIEDGRDFDNVSLSQGSLSSYATFVRAILPDPEEMDAIVGAFFERLAVLPNRDAYRAGTVYGIGGSVRAAAKMHAQLRQEAIRPKTMTADQIRAILDTCRNDPDAFAHLALKASAERIHTLVPGCLILGTLMGELRAERLDICKYGVREGYLVERVLG